MQQNDQGAPVQVEPRSYDQGNHKSNAFLFDHPVDKRNVVPY